MSIEKDLESALRSMERMPFNPGKEEAYRILKEGRPIYYGEDRLEPGEVVKEYPNGKKEIVTFNYETSQEQYIRDYP